MQDSPINPSASLPASEYLSDLSDQFLSETQGWGVLGLDCCAHANDQTPMALRVGDKQYSKGLGAHAPSQIVCLLGGKYASFDAQVGLQTGQAGSVIFQVFVDEKKAFDSGVMHETDGARAVHVDVSGGDELRLVVLDGGDGIEHDCANWAQARLVRDDARHGQQGSLSHAQIAPFARVMSWKPSRTDGARNGRLEEFPKEEIYLGRELAPEPDGCYRAPVEKGVACIGLEWLERRRVCQVALTLEAPDTALTSSPRVEYWTSVRKGVTPGSTTWQGSWAPLSGTLTRKGACFVYDIDWRKNPDARMGTFKVRWSLPCAAQTDAPRVRSIEAYSDALWKSVELLVESEKPRPGAAAQVSIYNGALFQDSSSSLSTRWEMGKPLNLRVLYSKPRSFKGDRTVLRLSLPEMSFGVSLEDLLTSPCIYVRDAGVAVSLRSSGMNLAKYRETIAGRKSVLEQVKSLPDQSFEAARRAVQRKGAELGPTALSLACDNHKFITGRDGSVEFDDSPEVYDCYERQPDKKYSCRFAPSYGSGVFQEICRQIEEGWMPIPTLSMREGDVLYTQQTFVAPFDRSPLAEGAPAWLNRKPLCVALIGAKNTGSHPSTASLSLRLLANAEKGESAQVSETTQGVEFRKAGKLLAFLRKEELAPLSVTVTSTALEARGELGAGQSLRCLVSLPAWQAEAGELPGAARSEELLAWTREHWKKMLSGSMKIKLPDELLSNIILASQTHCMLAARNEQGQRIAPWISSTFYGPLESESQSVIRGMQSMGQLDFARRAHEYFIRRYNRQGFLTTGYTWMGTGWHLWILGEYCALTGDSAWLKTHASEIGRVCDWVCAQMEKTRCKDAKGNPVPEYGLMPPGVQADWDAYAYYFCLNGYFYAGLREAALALKAVGNEQAPKWLKRAEELRQNILNSFHRVQALAPVYELNDGTWVPEYPTQAYAPCPTQDLHPGQDVGRSWAYDVELGAHHLVPMGVMDPHSSDSQWMMNHMEDVQFLCSGWHCYPGEESRRDWFNLGGFAKMQPYYARTAEVYALGDEVKPFIRSYFNTIPSLLNPEDLSLWEHFFNGAFNKTHETGYFLYQTRLMLLMERGQELWLAPFVTNAWMKDGMKVGVKDAPTRFGPVGYEISSHVDKGWIEASVSGKWRQSPRAVVLRVRHPEQKPMKRVFVNGVACEGFDPARETVRLEARQAREWRVRVEY